VQKERRTLEEDKDQPRSEDYPENHLVRRWPRRSL